MATGIPSFDRTVLETLPLMRRVSRPDVGVVYGEGTMPPEVSTVDEQGHAHRAVSSMGPFTIRLIWAIRLLGLMTVGVTDGRGVMPSGPPTRTAAVAARRETIVLFPCRVWPPDPGTPWQDQWPNESGSVPSPLQVENRHLAKGLVLCHSFMLGYTDFSLQRASSIFICQSTPRWVLLTSAAQARSRC